MKNPANFKSFIEQELYEKAFNTIEHMKMSMANDLMETETSDLDEARRYTKSKSADKEIYFDGPSALIKRIKRNPMLKKYIGKRPVYFDGPDLVIGDDTAVFHALGDDGYVIWDDLVKTIMKNIKPDLHEARRYTTSDDDTNIVMQLRSAEDLDGAKEIKFRRGSKKFDKKSISAVLKFHDSLKMPQDKRKFRIMLYQSPEAMEEIVSQLANT